MSGWHMAWRCVMDNGQNTLINPSRTTACATKAAIAICEVRLLNSDVNATKITPCVEATSWNGFWVSLAVNLLQSTIVAWRHDLGPRSNSKFNGSVNLPHTSVNDEFVNKCVLWRQSECVTQKGVFQQKAVCGPRSAACMPACPLACLRAPGRWRSDRGG